MAIEPDKPKHAGGRPLKFETVEALDLAIQNYFAQCDPHTEKRLVPTGQDEKGNMLFDARNVLTEPQPYTVSGLARALNISRETLVQYKNSDKFSDSILPAYERCHEYAEQQLYGKSAGGASFSLKNNWGWTDRKEIDHTTKGERMPLLGGATPLPEEDEGSDA